MYQYETQVDMLCAKHAINNLFGIQDFVRIEDLNASIVPSVRASKQNPKWGYTTSTLAACLKEKGVGCRWLVGKGRAHRHSHPVPTKPTEWAAACGNYGLIAHVNEGAGHFIALRTLARGGKVVWRLVDSMGQYVSTSGRIYEDFEDKDALAKHMGSLPIDECVAITKGDRFGDHGIGYPSSPPCGHEERQPKRQRTTTIVRIP